MLIKFLRSLPRWKSKIPPTDPSLALFINDTATDYHWGCYATSSVIKERLISAGYRVAPFSVAVTHRGMGNAPTSTSELSEFYRGLSTIAPDLWEALHQCAIVVVNGEGTLHRFHNGPRCLLALMWAAKRIGKPVHLINHSLFPSGGRETASNDVREYYRECLYHIDNVVARENFSINNYKELGIKATLGFDCLPIFAKRATLSKTERAIVLCGASHWSAETARSVAERLAPILFKQEVPIVFLSGGVQCPPEDRVHYEAMRSAIPGLRMVEAESAERWLSVIARAYLTITGRFHHLVAAVALSSPIVSLPGNTLKCEAVCDLFGLPSPIEPASPMLEERVQRALATPPALSDAVAEKARQLAERNFLRLPRAAVHL